MMTQDDYRHFVCIVAGDNPTELIAQYDANLKSEPKLIYRFQDAKKLKERYIEYYQQAYQETESEDIKQMLSDTIIDYSTMDDSDFFDELTEGFDIDEATGDAYTSLNLNGKYLHCNVGKIFSIPFLTKNGHIETFQAKKGDIDWEAIHLNNGGMYERTWEMVMEGSEPKNDIEKNIFENMKDKKTYFNKFETKENYVTSNTAFWGYAFVSEKIGWVDAEDVADQFVWMKNFYDVYIKNLSDDTLLTIYECSK